MVNDEVFRAILAMDSYNRRAGLNVEGTGLGSATLTFDSVDKGVTGASFFAQAYTWNGETVISYRGTDEGLDVVTGWTTGGGAYRGPGSQAQMAADFYKAIIGSASPYGVNVEFTGHSLGGGLAGLMASLYGKKAVVFDNMPFQLAALGAYSASTENPWVDIPGSILDILNPLIGLLDPLNVYDPAILAKYYFNGAIPTLPDWSQVTGYATAGEILTLARLLQTTLVTTLATGQLIWPIGDLDPIDRHSQALLAILLYGDKQVSPISTDWQTLRPYFVGHLFDNAIATAVGAANASDLRTMIAYSAIDEGALSARPYGDTGIRALFDDAGDIGKALNAAGASQTLAASAEAIAKIITQFAGQLAFGKVLQSSTIIPVTDGVVSIAQDGQTIAVDFGDQLWGVGQSGGTPPTNIVGRQDLTDAVFKQTDGIFEGTPGHPTPANDIRAGMKWLWNDDNSSIIDRFVFATTDGALTTTIPNRSSTSTKVSLFAAGGQNDNITGSRDNDFIFGGNGNDTLRGGDGNDLLAGGVGDDRLNGGAGRNFLTGGEGKDTVFYEATGENGVRLSATGITDIENMGGSKILQLTNTAIGGPVDRMVVEKVELTNKPDTLIVDRDALRAKTEIDMGDSNRQASDFNLDVLDLSNVGEGVTYRDGKIALGNLGSLKSFVGAQENLVVKNADKIVLTPFNDTVISGGRGNIIHTGDGADTIWVGSTIAIDDLSKDDRVTFAGLPLFGGLRNANSDSPWGHSYGGAVSWAEDVSGALQVNIFGVATTYILNWGSSGGMDTPFADRPGHISLFNFNYLGVFRLLDPNLPSDASQKGWWDLLGAFVKLTFGVQIWKDVDPLTLDLDGDGLELTGPSSVSASFDFNADGYAERSGWVRPDDGILMRDLNANGRIDNVTEMFGGATSGFAQLAALDGNHDGKVDAADNGLADFNGDGTVDVNDTIASLQVWRDLNENGVTEAGELFSLASLGIASISASRLRQFDQPSYFRN